MLSLKEAKKLARSIMHSRPLSFEASARVMAKFILSIDEVDYYDAKISQHSDSCIEANQKKCTQDCPVFDKQFDAPEKES